MRCLSLFLLLPILPIVAFGQSGVGALAGPAGQRGVWAPPNAGDERLVELDSTTPPPANPFAIETNPLQRTPRVPGSSVVDPTFKKLTISEVPFQPWARALYAYRQENQ